MSNVERIKLSPAAFMKMSKLKFLKFHNSHCSQWCDNEDKFRLCKGLDHFPDELVYLHWQGYPYDYLPSEFSPEELVDLNLRYSHIKTLWEAEQVDKLKTLWIFSFSDNNIVFSFSDHCLCATEYRKFKMGRPQSVKKLAGFIRFVQGQES